MMQPTGPVDRKSFWSRVPGTVAVIGGIVAAVAAAVGVLYQLNILGPDELKDIRVAGPSQALQHVGPCPVRMTYQGTISVDGGKGTVKYELLVGNYKDGGSKRFDGQGTQSVEHTFLVGGSIEGFVKLKTTEPESQTADTPISVVCQ
jgi:hypothetical protein